MSEQNAILRREIDEARSELSDLRRELRTPLNTVLGFAQLLKASPIGECEPVTQILTAANRLAQLIGDEAGAAPQPTESTPLTERAPSAHEAAYTVLCIEDNPANSRLIQRIFNQRSNIKLLLATSGAEGLARARAEIPDLVLLDLHLPDMHGAEVLRALREEEKTARVPVVVVSADATVTEIDRLLSAGARNYLTKPIDIARFLCTVDEILSGS